jgi:hypothetical protein
MQDEKFQQIQLTSVNYPILGAAAAANPKPLNIDLKNFEQTGVISRMYIRVFGPITVAGAGPGTATGNDNPEGMLTQATLTSTPNQGYDILDKLTSRSFRTQAFYERGYDIKAPAVPDIAGTYNVDFSYQVNFLQPLAVKPAEFCLPMQLFTNLLLKLQWGGREQFFTGGTNTWDLSGLAVQVWVELYQGIAGVFHGTCFSEIVFPAITASQNNLQLQGIPAGYVYDTLLLRSERNNVLVNDIITNWLVQSSGRQWTRPGELNAAMIQRMAKDTNLSDPAANQTGLYFINALKDGMITNTIDSLDAQLDMRIDEISGAGSQFPVLVSKRSIPNSLQLQGVVAGGAVQPTQ